jgi:Tol biopolymer transport system component
LALAAIATWAGCLTSPREPDHENVAFDVAPQGKSIVFSAGGDLFLLRLDTGRPVRLTKTKAVESWPAFSPDGDWLAYAARADVFGARHLFLRSLDGQVVRQITTGHNDDSMPSFSADGRQIVFARVAPYAQALGGNQYHIYIIGRDGAGLRRITTSAYFSLFSPRFLDKDAGPVIYSSARYGADNQPDFGGDWATLLFTVEAKGNTPPGPLTKETGHANAVGSEPHVSRDGRRVCFVSDRAEAFAYDVY